MPSPSPATCVRSRCASASWSERSRSSVRSTFWLATPPTRCRGRTGSPTITTEQFDRVFKTNVYAMFWLCKAAIPHMPPGRRSSPARRSRRSNPRHTCSTTPPPRARSSPSPRRWPPTSWTGHPGQLGRPGPGVDPAHPGDDARGDARVVRKAVADGPRRPARRARSDLCLPRLAGVQLHHLGGHRRHRRLAHHLTGAMPDTPVRSTPVLLWGKDVARSPPNALARPIGSPTAPPEVQLGSSWPFDRLRRAPIRDILRRQRPSGSPRTRPYRCPSEEGPPMSRVRVEKGPPIKAEL